MPYPSTYHLGIPFMKTQTTLLALKRQNFKDKFKIIKSGFKYKKDRERAETFMIRVNKPSLNDQYDGGNTKLVAQFINIGTTPKPREGVL